jgi:hypothetical protein
VAGNSRNTFELLWGGLAIVTALPHFRLIQKNSRIVPEKQTSTVSSYTPFDSSFPVIMLYILILRLFNDAV